MEKTGMNGSRSGSYSPRDMTPQATGDQRERRVLRAIQPQAPTFHRERKSTGFSLPNTVLKDSQEAGRRMLPAAEMFIPKLMGKREEIVDRRSVSDIPPSPTSTCRWRKRCSKRFSGSWKRRTTRGRCKISHQRWGDRIIFQAPCCYLIERNPSLV